MVLYIDRLDTSHVRVSKNVLAGFSFEDGKYLNATRPRFTPGMKSQSYTSHSRTISDVAVVAMDEDEGSSASGDRNAWVVTFAVDWYICWLYAVTSLAATNTAGWWCLC
jgi:hypothetical protein